MAYADYEDAIDLYGNDYVSASITHDDGANTAALTRALERASSEMDSYLGAVYAVPVSPVPEIVEQYCIDIAIYRASADAGAVTDEKRKRYEDAIAWCKSVAAGKAVLIGVEEPASEDQHLPTYVTSTRIFSRTKMGGL